MCIHHAASQWASVYQPASTPGDELVTLGYGSVYHESTNSVVSLGWSPPIAEKKERASKNTRIFINTQVQSGNDSVMTTRAAHSSRLGWWWLLLWSLGEILTRPSPATQDCGEQALFSWAELFYLAESFRADAWHTLWTRVLTIGQMYA